MTQEEKYLNTKKEALEWITQLDIAVKNDDVPTLIRMINSSNLVNYLPKIPDFVKVLLVNKIKNYVENNQTPFIISRKAEYNIETKDYYTIKDNKLYRNGDDTKWSSIGKLYHAYKKINEDELSRADASTDNT
jgi:hypothetical protein